MRIGTDVFELNYCSLTPY